MPDVPTAGCAFRGRNRIPEPTLTAERWFLSVCYPKAEISYETKDGKTIKLPQTITHYAVELKKGDEGAEIVVDAAGKVIEPAKFTSPK